MQDGGEWFECSLSGESLGKSFAMVHVNGQIVCYAERGVWLFALLRRGFLRDECIVQHASMTALYSVRMNQRNDLITELKSKSQALPEEGKQNTTEYNL